MTVKKRVKMIFNFLTNERLIHSLKTTFACLLGFAVTQSLGTHPDPWLVITVLVVMCAQINVGSMIQKSYARFLGTLSGSLIAALTIKFFGTDDFIFALVIGASALFFSYLATGQSKFNDAGTLGAVTVTIILIGQNPTLQSAFNRFSEISLGIVLAALVSQFILPVHARSHLRKSQAQTLRQLANYYRATLLTDKKIENSELDETIVKSLINQRKLSIDAAREPFGLSFNVGHFNQYLWYAREILRSIDFMHQTCVASVSCKNLFANTRIIKNFHDVICQTLNEIAQGIDDKNIQAHVILIPNPQELKEIIATEKTALPAEDLVYVDAFLFCATILTSNLKKLFELVKEFQ